MSDEFHTAAERARALFGKRAWALLGLHEQAELIYKEMRALDAERVAREPKQSTPQDPG